MLFVSEPQNTSAAQLGARAENIGELQLPQHLSTVPCALLLDREGRLYATVNGLDPAQQPGEKIQQYQSVLRLRNTLERRALKAEGLERARHMTQACRLGIAPPKDALRLIDEAAPDNAEGLYELASFNPQDREEELLELELEPGLAMLTARLENSSLSGAERQALNAMAIGHLQRRRMEMRRQNIFAPEEERAIVLKQHLFATACVEIDPSSVLAHGAQRFISPELKSKLEAEAAKDKERAKKQEEEESKRRRPRINLQETTTE